jgi:DMSO/TMAO reductase YedYZ heme-binding membrane subunit
MSALRIVTLMCLFARLSKAIYDSDAIRLDARPITDLIHRTGDWALIFLLVALASTNGMVRRLGSKRWQRLHQAIYMIGLLVLIQYFLRFKLIESTPIFATGLFGWLIGYRLLVWWRNTGNELPTWMLPR